MNRLLSVFERLPRALLSLQSPPPGSGWNHQDLIDLLPDRDAALRPAAVLVGLLERDGVVQVLLTRRTEALRHHAGQISFPGGCIESFDTNPVMAALREAHEEVGLCAEHAQPLGYLDPFTTITGFHVFPVVARIAAEFSAQRDPSEVDEIFEVPLNFLLDPGNARRFQVEYRGGARSLIEFVYRDYRIWGATAAILVNLRQRLERIA